MDHGKTRIFGKQRAEEVENPEENLNPAMEEVAEALAQTIPDPAVRLNLVNQLFLCEPNAPYVLALRSLTGMEVDPEIATEAWRLTLDLQVRWTARLGEVMSVKSAAIEAVERASKRALPVKLDDMPATSMRHYLDRDISTGLYQRSHYNARLAEVLKTASRDNPASLIFMYLSGLDTYEQTHGEAEAERVMQSIGEHVRHHFRVSDIACRYGPHYIAVLLPETPLAVAHTLGEELMQMLQTALLETGVTVTMGVAAYPGAGRSMKEFESAAASVLDESRSRGEWTVGAYVAPSSGPEVNPGWRIAKLLVPVALLAMAFVVKTAYTVEWKNDSPGTAIRKGADLSPSAIDEILGSGPRDELRRAGQHRSDGDYASAVDDLTGLAKKANNTGERVMAMTAAAAASAADGEAPSALLKSASDLAQFVPTENRGKLMAIINLVQARWDARHEDYNGAYTAMRNVVWKTSDINVLADSAPDMVQVFDTHHDNKAAVSLLQQWSRQETDPGMSAAFDMLAASASGNSYGVLRAYSRQPDAVVASGPLGQAACIALARATVGDSSDHNEWFRMCQQVLSTPNLSTTAAMVLRLALVDRLVAVGDPVHADAILAGVTGQYRTDADGNWVSRVPPAEQAHALFLAALSEWRTEPGSDIARRMWQRIADGNNVAQKPAQLWIPAPDERWYFEAAAMLSGQEKPDQYQKFLALEGPARAAEGKNYVDGFHYVARGAVTTDMVSSPWRVVGPFSNDNKKGFETAYPPEKSLNLDDSYTAVNGRKVTWQPAAPDATGLVDFTKIFRPHDWVVAYAVTYVHSNQAQKVLLSAGSDDGIKAWVNQKLVVSHDVYRGAHPGEEKVWVDLKAGWNTVLLKITQGGSGWGFFFDLLGKDNNPAADLVFAPSPRKAVGDTRLRVCNLLGPYSNDGAKGFDTAYEPEKSVDLTRSYSGLPSGMDHWRPMASEHSGSYFNLLPYFKQPDWKVAYAAFQVKSPSTRTVLLSVGSDDGCKVWMNGKQLISHNVARAAAPGQDETPVELKEGWNSVLMKIVNQRGQWGFYFDLLDKDHQPLQDITYTLKANG